MDLTHDRAPECRPPRPPRPPAYGDALARTERHLALVGRTQGRAALDRWRDACGGELAGAPIEAASELPGWLRTRTAATANRVLGRLVLCAQGGDQLALVAVLACLAPGVRSLAAKARVGVDEALSEVAVGVLDFPVERRTAIAGGLLLDARNRLWRAERRASRTEPFADDSDPGTGGGRSTGIRTGGGPGRAGGRAHPVAPGELGDAVEVPAAQRLVAIVCQAHRQGVVDGAEASLILDTRVAGHGVRPVAQRLGLTPTAAYQRRARAESRLGEAT